MAKKMSKAERKAAKAAQKKEQPQATQSDIEERALGYDADFYVNEAGEEIECVRIDFVRKPAWYNEMFCAGDIHYKNNELQALCSDGTWQAGKDIKSCLARTCDEQIFLLGDDELKKAWRQVATSSSKKAR